MSKKETQTMNAHFSFYIPVDEQTHEFFKRMYEEQIEHEKAVENRIRQLFDEFIGVEDKTTEQNAYYKVLKVFALGYQLGWNDQHNLAKIKR